MADKTYKFISVCERPKPVQTNNAYQFSWHVAFCKTCLEKLPEGILQQLQPRLSQLMEERAKKNLPAEQEPPIETIDAEKTEKMKPGIVIKDKPRPENKTEPPVPKADKQQQSQFDTLIKDSPVFQGLAKSMEEVKTEINGQINALGDMMQTRMERIFKGISEEKGAVEETGKELPPDQTPPPDNPPGTGAPSGDVQGGGRRSPFGEPEVIPAGMKDGYKAGDRPPPQVPPSDTPPGIEQPPLGIEQPPPDLTDKGMPKLQTPEQIGLFKRYLAEEEARLAGGGKAPSEKTGEFMDSARGGVGLLKEVVDIFRGGGQNQASALAGTPIGEMLQVMKAVNELSMGNFKGMLEMMKAVREGEKIIGRKESPPEHVT